MSKDLSTIASEIRERIERSALNAVSTVTSESDFNALALRLFAAQFQSIPEFQSFCRAHRKTPETVMHWTEIPALPTDAFKDFELSSIPANERKTFFLSSGTTAAARSKHFHSSVSLALYELSLCQWFEANVLSDWDDLVETEAVRPLDRPAFISLTPPPDAAPHSSLVHMFATLATKLGSRDSLFCGCVGPEQNWVVDFDRLLFALRKSMCANRPLFLLGTAFSFVHMIDYFAAHNIRYRLAAGSRVIETGGYKGQSRVISKAELHAGITRHLGIARSRIITEYGMSELSSQAYDINVSNSEDAPRTFQFPPWARAQVVSPETGREVSDGETGLIRIVDLANVWSVCSLQTKDLGIKRGDAFELLGRASEAEPRGCSLMTA